MPALAPDVTVIHAQEADRDGNVQLWGIPGVQKEAVLAADAVARNGRTDRRSPRAAPGGVLIPGWVIDAVAVAPGGSQPSYSLDITERDNDFYKQWDAISRDREAFTSWIEHDVRGEAAVA